MSKQITKCHHCGSVLENEDPNDPPHYWFSCEVCGAIYLEKDGLWYEEDEYHDRFDD